MVITNSRLSQTLLQLTIWIQTRARLVALGFVSLAVVSCFYAVSNLGVNTATNEMFSRNLEWFQQFNAFRDEFPILDRNVIVSIEGEVPEQVDQAQLRLSQSLQSDPALFGQVLALESSEFFLQNGLLFLSLEELERLGERLAAMQAITGRLNQEPNIAGFISLLTDNLETGSSRSEELDRAIAEITDVFAEASAGRPQAISWQNLFAGNSATNDPLLFRRIIVVVPQLDFEGAEPRRRVLDGIRTQALSLGLTMENGISVRLTGGLALEQEELSSVSDGIIQGAIATLALVICILLITFRSGRLFLASLITLLCGLSITAAFTALTIGYINLISVAFVILYIGLGIDFAIHYCLRYRELMAAGHAHTEALPEASRDTGTALVLCAVTSSVGFLAFVPTGFSGVAQLGLIAGFGMFASLFSTLVLLPSLITISGPPRNAMVQHTPPLFGIIGGFVFSHLNSVRLVIAMLAVVVVWLATQAEFDSNPVNLRDPESESVMAYRDLLADSQATPLTLSALVPADQVASLGSRLKALPEIGDVRSMGDMVPDQQQTKLALLDDYILFLGMPEAINLDAVDLTRDLSAIREAVPLLVDSSNQAEVALGDAINQWLEQLTTANSGLQLSRLNAAILENLVFSWNRIANGFQAVEFTSTELPADTRQLWLADDGRHRIEIISATPLLNMQEIGEYVEAVARELPEATGQPELQYNAGRSVVAAFVQAISTAVIAVLILLLILLRNIRHTLAVIIPLLLATTATAAVVTLIQLPFNFANVITLPLLIGVGVDNGIHMVKRHQHSGGGSAGGFKGSGAALMTSSTARAILFSTITTIGSFGTLAFSNHPGTASMGVVLVIGMTASLLAALFVVPAVLPNGQPRN